YYSIDFPNRAVCVVVRRGDEFLLIRQYRFIVDEHVWAIPSGGVENGESIVDAATREMEEETGYRPSTPLEHLVGYYPSYGSGNQRFELFLADDPVCVRESHFPRLQALGGVRIAAVPTIRTWTGSIEAMLLGALAGGSVATLAPGGGLLRPAVASALGAILGSRLSGDRSSSSPTAAPAILRHVPWLGLIFLLPILTLPVAPGADMAMHVALARALREGSRTLSPAWGVVEVSAYPRGFSAWVALLSPLLGYAKAGLLVACASYLLYQLALQRLFEALSVPLAAPLAVLCLFIAKVPQSFFTWGGNPTAFAAALALLAVAELVRRGAERPLRTAAFAAVLLAGAAAAHPMGAC